MEFWSYSFFLATVFAVATVINLKLVLMWFEDKISFVLLLFTGAMVCMITQGVIGDTHSQALEMMGLGTYSLWVITSCALWVLEVVLMFYLLDILRNRWNLYWRGTDLV